MQTPFTHFLRGRRQIISKFPDFQQGKAWLVHTIVSRTMQEQESCRKGVRIKRKLTGVAWRSCLEMFHPHSCMRQSWNASVQIPQNISCPGWTMSSVMHWLNFACFSMQRDLPARTHDLAQSQRWLWLIYGAWQCPTHMHGHKPPWARPYF